MFEALLGAFGRFEVLRTKPTNAMHRQVLRLALSRLKALLRPASDPAHLHGALVVMVVVAAAMVVLVVAIMMMTMMMVMVAVTSESNGDPMKWRLAGRLACL